MNIDTKREIKRHLSSKQKEEIAKKLGITLNYVRMVLHGTRNNQEVFDLAIEMIKTAKQKEQDFLKLIES